MHKADVLRLLDTLPDDMPIFPLLGKDITSDLFTELWTDAQRFLASRIQMGWTLEAACDALTDKVQTLFEDDSVGGLTPKQQDAHAIADRMKEYPARKLAD